MYTNLKPKTQNSKVGSSNALFEFILSPKRIIFLLISLFVFTSFAFLRVNTQVSAAVGIRKTINFQGKLVNSDGTNVTDGEYDIVFKIYTQASGGAAVWTENWTSSNDVTVRAGLFQVELGSITSLPGSVNFATDNIYLGITVESDSEMEPRIRFTSVPQAFNAEKVNGLTVTNTSDNPFSSATTLKIGDGKTVIVNNTLTLSGTDSTSFTFPSSGGNIVTEDFAQTLTNKVIGTTGLTFTGANLDITTSSNQDFVLTPNGSGNIGFNASTPLASFDVRANSVAGGILAVASVSGSTSFAALLVDNGGVGDILAASTGGVTKFAVKNNGQLLSSNYKNNGGILYTATSGLIQQTAGGSDGNCLTFTGGLPAWGPCGSGTGGSNWVLSSVNGTLSPINNTLDLLIGAASTTSAKFSVLNIAGNQTPAASVSAVSAGTGIYMSGDGSLQSVRKNTLTIGGADTGFVNIDSGSGKINLLDNTSITGTLDGLTGLTLSSGSITLGGLTGSGQCLVGGASAAWGSCGAGGGDNFWQYNTSTGIIANGNLTTDLLIGGVSTASANFRVTGNNANRGTQVAASVSANTSFAGFVIDNKGVGDLFAASSSGVMQMVLRNNGALGLGVNLPTAKLDVNGTASISASLSFRTGAGSIQTTAGNTLTIGGATTGDIQLKAGNKLGIHLKANGDIGVGTNNLNPRASFDVRPNLNNGGGTMAIASVSGTTSFAGLMVDNSLGDLFTASSSGITRFTIKQSGTVIIGNSTDGLTFDYLNGGPVYTGRARPTQSIILSPEYAGAVLTASGSATTTGSMTSDASHSASFRTYYEWVSTQTVLQDYTVAVRITLPKDFSSWPTTGNAMTISYNNGANAPTANKLDVYAYLVGDSSGNPVYFSTGNVNGTAKTWSTISLTAGQLDNNHSTDWDDPDEQIILYLKMYATGTYNYTQIGDIVLNYMSKF